MLVLDFLITRQIDKDIERTHGIRELPQSIELSGENFINLFTVNDDKNDEDATNIYAVLENTCSFATLFFFLPKAC